MRLEVWMWALACRIENKASEQSKGLAGLGRWVPLIMSMSHIYHEQALFRSIPGSREDVENLVWSLHEDV